MTGAGTKPGNHLGEEADEFGPAPFMSMRTKTVCGAGLLMLWGLFCVSRASPPVHPSPVWVLVGMGALVCLLLSSNHMRRSLIGVFSNLGTPGVGGMKMIHGGLNPFALIFLMFGFLGVSNVVRLPSSLSLSEVTWWSGLGLLGITQIWIGFTYAARKGQKGMMGRTAAYLCLLAGLWSLVQATTMKGIGTILWFYKSGSPAINWEAIHRLVMGSGRLPFFFGAAGWILLCVILIELWLSRREGPLVDLASFLRRMTRPIGAYLCFVGICMIALLVVFFPSTLSEASVQGEWWNLVLFVSITVMGALLCFSAALELLTKPSADYLRKRLLALLVYCLVLYVSTIVMEMATEQWFLWSDWPMSLRLNDMTQKLYSATLAGFLLALIHILLRRGRTLRYSLLKGVALLVGCAYGASWLFAATL